MLRAEIERLPKAATLVFPNALGDRMRSESKCDLGLRRCAKRAGLEPFGWHVLRPGHRANAVERLDRAEEEAAHRLS